MTCTPNACREEVDIGIPAHHVDVMEKPLVLITIDKEKGCVLNQETCNLLLKLDTALVVVGIAGTYRTGKSYLMNLLAGRKTGFELGSTVESKTKGIWIWCRPHPSLPNTTLILMDTEGLQDASSNADDTRDMNIIVLALLLSSTFIYNTTGRIDNSLISQLGFVSELTKYIKVQAGEELENDSDFDMYFPVLIVTIRDFTLALEIDGQKVSAGQYFERCLILQEDKGNSKSKHKIANYNEPRIKIRKYFPQRKRHCFVLPTPVKNFCATVLAKLPFLYRDEMNPEFLKECAKYQELVFQLSPQKTFGNHDNFNGRMFVDTVASYVSALLTDDIPCIQSALKLTADKENRRLLEECVKKYKMAVRLLNLPVSLEELMQNHQYIVADITREYKEKLIFVEWDDVQTDFKANFESAYNELIKLNEEKSRVKCEQILVFLNEFIKEQMEKKKYLCAGGYDAYMQDLHDLKRKYKNTESRGVKSDQVLHEFLQGKETEIDSIIVIDKEMTSGKVKEEAEKRLREEINRREIMMQEEIEAAKKREQTLQKTLIEATNAMKEEWDSRFEQQREEYERAMADRQRNYDEMTSELKNEIDELREQLKPKPTPKSKSFLDRFCTTS